MYHLLIEAAGLRQTARINVEMHHRFLRETRDLLERHGLHPIHHDGDILVWADTARMQPDAAAVCGMLRALLEHLHRFTESLLDIVVLADYIEVAGGASTGTSGADATAPSDDHRAGTAPHIGGESAVSAAVRARVAAMVDLLRYARHPGSLYLSATVGAALGPLVTTDSAGPLGRVVAFSTDGAQRAAPFAAAVADRAAVDRLSTHLRERAGTVYLEGRDPSVVEATVHVACDGAGRTLSVVDCTSVTDEDELYTTIVAGLPEPGEGDVRAIGGEAAELARDMRRALLSVAHRARHPGGRDISTGLRSGELRYVIDSTRPRDGEPPVVLLLLNAAAALQVVSSFLDTRARTPRADFVIVHGVPSSQMIAVGELSTSERSASHRYWTEGADVELAPYLTRELGAGHRRLLYLASRVGRVVDPDWYDEIVPLIGITLAERSRLQDELMHEGMLLSRLPFRTHPEIAAVARELLTPEAVREVDEAISGHLARVFAEGAGQIGPRLWPIVARGLAGSDRHAMWHQVLHVLATGGDFAAFDRLVEEERVEGTPWVLSIASARLRLYLRDSRGPEQCTDDAAELRSAVDSDLFSPALRAAWRLSLGEYALASRDYATALDHAKQVVLANQAQSSDVGRAASHLLMARIMLAQRRMSEAGQYLGFAVEEASTDRATALIAEMLEAIRLVHFGNLTRADRALAAQTEGLMRSGFTEWLLLAWFLRGRIAFEFGEYELATERFARLADYASGSGSAHAARVARVWSARAALHSERDWTAYRESLEAEVAHGDAEAAFVVGESLARQGAFREALPYLGQAVEKEKVANRWPRLGVCWDNGFATVEDLILAGRPGQTQLLNLARAYQAWALANTDAQDEAAAIFYDLTRGEASSGDDPHTGLYTYLYATTLPAQRSSDRDDRATVLGKAVKLVQERTSRIDEYRDKMRFLKANAWNGRLMESARHHNLV